MSSMKQSEISTILKGKSIQLNMRRMSSELGKMEYERELIPILKDIIIYFNCKRCMDCCKIPVTLSLTDCDILAKFDSSFWDKLDGEKVENILKEPCQYQTNNSCSVYTKRPQICRVYPFSLCYTSSEYYATVVLWLCPLGKEILSSLKEFGASNPRFRKLTDLSESSIGLNRELVSIVEKIDRQNNQESEPQLPYVFLSTYVILEFQNWLQDPIVNQSMETPQI